MHDIMFDMYNRLALNLTCIICIRQCLHHACLVLLLILKWFYLLFELHRSCSGQKLLITPSNVRSVATKILKLTIIQQLGTP